MAVSSLLPSQAGCAGDIPMTAKTSKVGSVLLTEGDAASSGRAFMSEGRMRGEGSVTHGHCSGENTDGSTQSDNVFVGAKPAVSDVAQGPTDATPSPPALPTATPAPPRTDKQTTETAKTGVVSGKDSAKKKTRRKATATTNARPPPVPPTGKITILHPDYRPPQLVELLKSKLRNAEKDDNNLVDPGRTRGSVRPLLVLVALGRRPILGQIQDVPHSLTGSPSDLRRARRLPRCRSIAFYILYLWASSTLSKLGCRAWVAFIFPAAPQDKPKQEAQQAAQLTTLLAAVERVNKNKKKKASAGASGVGAGGAGVVGGVGAPSRSLATFYIRSPHDDSFNELDCLVLVSRVAAVLLGGRVLVRACRRRRSVSSVADTGITAVSVSVFPIGKPTPTPTRPSGDPVPMLCGSQLKAGQSNIEVGYGYGNYGVNGMGAGGDGQRGQVQALHRLIPALLHSLHAQCTVRQKALTLRMMVTIHS
ncbi:unnamed protein product [Vitrella brassicaformis CCMP3155]|uniref:Uncharacterized protein n=1 Tax=Vitrella brassicaformis (strain CCMP3155) TaxID=1169540 RepID=A0A0G4EB79_VITBC|nr:unnamed protein product [Vitrella brassicaformis CCMP3155]|eukprot:CEL92519.1 unnamed protein product [Vitrella brassicaformis CCMP3155]